MDADSASPALAWRAPTPRGTRAIPSGTNGALPVMTGVPLLRRLPAWPCRTGGTQQEQAMDYLQALRGMARRFADARRQAAARQEFLQLDARTVHDLGMSASEFDSFWAEAHGE